MNGLKVVQVAELRAKLAAIPAKIILTIVVAVAMNWDTDIEKTLTVMSGDVFLTAKNILIIYGLVSYVYFFIKIFKNFIVGTIVAALAAYAAYTLKDNFTAEQINILMLIMIFGGPVLDVLRFIRYKNMKREVIEESEEYKGKIDDIYENVHGYDDGYYDGYETGYEQGWNEKISYEEQNYIEDGYDESYKEDDRYVEQQRRPELPSGFFEGCKTAEAVKKRYRDLCKVYHPDSGNGSEAIFEAICEEYNSIMDE